MTNVVRVPLEGGGAIHFEAATAMEGPVKAGRVGDAIRELPQTLNESLVVVREASREIMTQLRAGGPSEAEVEFGLDLSASMGAIITKSEAAVHFKVRLLWRSGDGGE
ncbi:hypothetical protein JCM13580A_24580 [Streptomyces drozdowiczii]|uniref:CU044_2847 family protein n=1 Tax=Streptomyces drozdowiczii TaxID=202862 RepID=UPI0031EC210B